MRLDQVKLNHFAVIKQVSGKMKRRLYDLGFLPGEMVQCVLVSPFLDPKAYMVRNSLIALRNCDARDIEVQDEED